MNRILQSALCATVALASLGCVACSGSDNSKEAPKTAVPAKADAKKGDAHQLPNYRYVDLDTILSRYNLAKDYNEEMLRMQTSMEAEVKRHENSIQSLASQMQNKVQNNSYLSQQSFDADQRKLAQMQSSAEKSVGTLQQKFQESALKAQKAVNDSIENYIKEYNASKHYDAIFFKAATLFIDPDLDITDEVVEGLNARYNKVKK